MHRRDMNVDEVVVGADAPQTFKLKDLNVDYLINKNDVTLAERDYLDQIPANYEANIIAEPVL